MQRHRLGTSAGGVAGMSDICSLLNIGSDPQSTFQEYTEIVGSDLTGAPIEAGFSIATWTWDRMHQADFDYLLNLASDSASASVYIRTRKNAGASGFDFGNYSAIMKRPKWTSRDGLTMNGVTVEFVSLVAA